MPPMFMVNMLRLGRADIYTSPYFAFNVLRIELRPGSFLALLGWKIDKGAWQGVSLDGLSVMGVVHSDNTLGDYMHPDVVNPRAVIIVDERATPEQRMALSQLAKHMGGDLLSNTWFRTEALRQIQLHHRRHAFAHAGEDGGRRIDQDRETRALAETDKICHNEEVWYQPLTQCWITPCGRIHGGAVLSRQGIEHHLELSRQAQRLCRDVFDLKPQPHRDRRRHQQVGLR